MFGEDAFFDPVRSDAEDFLRDNPEFELEPESDDEIDLPFDEGIPPFQSDETPMGEALAGE